MAGEMMAIKKHVASGARFNAMTFHRLAGIANQHVMLLDDMAPDDEALLRIAKLTRLGNDSAALPMSMINATSKDKDQADDTSKDAFLERVTGKVVGVTHDPD